MKRGGSLTFAPGINDPIYYDRIATEYLIRICHTPIELAIETLRENYFAFESMQLLQRDALDIELLYRQCIPASGVGVRLGFSAEKIARFLVLFAICQTLILNHMDRHLDLSSSYGLRDPELLLADVHAVMCHSVAELYRGMAIGADGTAGSAALREMARVSLNIVQSMYDNYRTRFREEYLDTPELVISAYQDPVRSRHLGSGFYASSITGVYAFFDLYPPSALIDIITDMRRLRQRVDEISDIFEDTATGLISYPVARLLSESTHHSPATEAIRAVWNRSRELLATTGPDAGRMNAMLRGDVMLGEAQSKVMDLLVASGVMASCYGEAAELWKVIRDKIRKFLDIPTGEVLGIVIDLKRAFLERLALSGWADVPPGHTFNDMRFAVTGKGHEQSTSDRKFGEGHHPGRR